MQAFFVYLLKIIIYSGILFGYYHVALRNKRFHYYNRFYLLMSVVLSLALPFLQLQIWQWKSSNLQVINLASIMVTSTSEKESATHSLSLSLNDFTLLAYGIIVVCLLLSFLSGLLKIIRMKKQYPSEKVGDVLFINTDLQQAPFSFFKNLFWKNSIDISGETGRQIFRHELTHIEQKHSSDKLFMQLTTLIFWLNPFFWLIQKELSLIHEFIADEKSVAGKDSEMFAQMLLQSQFGKSAFLPLQSFYYSSVKRRLHMLTSSSKTSHSYARRILALPVLSLSILLFAFRFNNDHQPIISSHANAPFVLVVDAGHGGTDNGAISKTDAREKDINLIIANKVAELAPQYGITVKMTRTEDATVALEDRMNIIKNVQPDACISIHVNNAPAEATPKDAFEVYITKSSVGEKYADSRLLGSSILQSVKANFPVEDNIMQRKQGIYVLDQNPYPAIILECGYMNGATAQRFTTDAGAESVAKDILEGVVAYANNHKETAMASADTTGKPPVYMLDGKEISEAEMKKLDNNKIESVNVLKGKDATDKYGKKGENGVVVITMKKKPSGSPVAADSNYEIRPRNAEAFTGIYYIGEKEAAKADVDKIPADNIESISVWKGDEAVKKYGDKGKNGVTVITLKNKNLSTSASGNEPPKEEYKALFTTAQEAPSFPGGNEAWVSYLQRNLHPDVPAKNKAPNGMYTVTVTFQVDEEGNISHIKAVNDPGYGTAAEAVRVIQRGPKWIPAKQNGHVVTSEAKQMITFQIAG